MVGQGIISEGLQLPLPILITLLGGMVTPFIGLISEKIRLRLTDTWMVFVSALSLYGVYTLYDQVSKTAGGVLLIYSWGQAPPFSGCFEIDMLGVYMAFSIGLLSLLVSIYSISYMEHETRSTEFNTLVIFMVSGMFGIVMSGDLFTLFIFWELMGLSSYVLVSFLKRNWGPIEAGFKYLIMSATAGAFLLLSMALIYGMAGTLNFATLAASIRGAPMTQWTIMLFATIIVGFGVKSAIVPLHTWLPDAHPEAPSPISALLSGIVIETGLYAMTRVLYITFEPSFFKMPITVLALVTMTVGNLLALRQNDLKRMLAYSSIGQVGYMLIGISTGLTYGLLGTFLHIFNHSLMKGMAFLSVGSIVHETGTRDLDKLKGVGRMMPWTTLSIFVAFMGLGGVPGTSGFISKFILFNASLGAGIPILALAGVLNSTLSMAYYLRVLVALLSKKTEETIEAKEAPILMVGVAMVMAMLIIVLGFYPSPIVGIASEASKALIDGLSNYVGAVL
jgi:proton-translocating NADH-quinone oxidoreductase chain N